MTTQHRRDVDDLASGRNDGWTDALLRDRLTEEEPMHGFVGPDDGPEETVVSTKNEAAELLHGIDEWADVMMEALRASDDGNNPFYSDDEDTVSLARQLAEAVVAHLDESEVSGRG